VTTSEGDDVARNGGSRPIPDPTALTTAALEREIEQLQELIESKIERLETKMTGHFLIDGQRFSKIDEQFRTIESQRVEQKRDTQDALTAALTAQKEAVGKQDEANQKAITKSEATTTDTLNKLSQLFKTTTDALGDKIDDLKERIGRLEATKVGATENRTSIYATVAVIGSVIVASIAVIGLAIKVLS
jgi:hypothetical protein